MASLTDLLTAMQNGVTGINTLVQQGPKFSSLLVSNFTGLNSLSTAETVILSLQSSRTSVVFYNPSSAISLLVYPTQVSTAVSFTRAGGAFVLLPQDYLMLSGNVGQSWTAQASSGSSVALTVMTW